MSEHKIAIIGLGFVGLPLALSFAMRGVKVYGIDVNQSLVSEVNNGESHHTEKYEGKSLKDILKEQLLMGNFSAHTSLDEVKESIDTYIVTVGIPTYNGELKTDYIVSAANSIKHVLKDNDTVVFRSTLVPGMSNDLLRPILEESGLKAGVHFHLAYASERIAEGRAFDEFVNMPLVVGGINEKSSKKASDILGIVTKAPIHFGSSMEVVEASKVIENVQRDVNIAMVQEFSRICERFGLDIFELIQLANTHSRVQLLNPGPGVGGYCIPNAYHYLKPLASQLKMEDLPLLRTARQINENVPNIVIDLLRDSLSLVGKELKESTVSVFGLAMKDFSNDDRISPPVEIAQTLVEYGVNVKAFDPAVPTEYEFKVSTVQEAVENSDAILFLTEQEGMKELDYSFLASLMNNDPVFIDTKNISTSIDVSSFKNIKKI